MRPALMWILCGVTALVVHGHYARGLAADENRQRVALGLSLAAPSPKKTPDPKRDSLPGPQVVTVVKNGPAHQAGILVGDCIVRVQAKKVVSPEDVLKLTGEMEAGKLVKLAIKRQDSKSEWATHFVELTPITEAEFLEVQKKEQDEQRTLLAERNKQAKERAAELHVQDQAAAEARRKELQKRPPLEITAVGLNRDILNLPVLAIRVTNNRTQRIEAFEVTIECFTKFGDPVKGLRGSHIFEGIAQDEVGPEGESTAKWQLTFHSNTGLAKVRLERVKLADGTVWKPEGDKDGWVEVKQK